MSLDSVKLNSDKINGSGLKTVSKEPVKTQTSAEPVKSDVVKIYPEKSVYNYKTCSIYDRGCVIPSNVAFKGVAGKKYIPHNIVKADSANEAGKKAGELLSNCRYKIATAGYSEPPEGYKNVTKEFLTLLEGELGDENTAYITSPTTTSGSIDAITTEVEGLEDGTLVYMTSKEYVDYIEPSKFPETIDSKDYENTPKFVLPEQTKYSEATAKASNTFIAIGGRKATVDDFVNAIKHGNKAVIVDNTSLNLPAWSDKENKIDNATRYLTEQINAVKEGKPLPYAEVGEFTEQFIKDNMEKIENLVRFCSVDDNPETITNTAKQAADFLKQ